MTWTRFILGLGLTLGLAPIFNSAAAQEAVYVSDIHDVDNGDLGVKPAALSLVGARNGGFSAKVVVSGSAAKTLKPVMSELKGPGVISASQCIVRYAIPWDQNQFKGWGRPPGADILVETFPPATATGNVPVWLTVKVPKDAKTGVYTGQLALGPASVPVKLDIRDWTLPDPKDYQTWIELVESPDTLAVEYKIPWGSDKHWALIGKSFRLIADTGSGVVCIPLIAHTNYGNEESMVRWIKKGSGYDHEFTLMDKYLDVVAQNLGKPKIIQIYTWDQTMIGRADANVQSKGKGPRITVVDPATNKAELVELARLEAPGSKELWKPVWDGIRSRLAKRGWEDRMMLATMCDYQPSQEEMKVLKDLSGGIPWTTCSHHVPWLHGKPEWMGVPIGHSAVALDWQYNLNPAKGRYYGWKRQPFLHGQYWRFGTFNGFSYPAMRHETECLITGNKSGVSHLGADFWPCIKGKSGMREATVTERFPESMWHSLNIGSWMLAPGSAEPLGTARLELFREGVQECEGRIAIERVLTDDKLKGKLGADLAKRAQDYLDQRLVTIWKGRGIAESDLQAEGLVKEYRKWYGEIEKRAKVAEGAKWFIQSGWQDRSAKLFDLANEVERKVGGGR